jgi:hypothetical protein
MSSFASLLKRPKIAKWQSEIHMRLSVWARIVILWDTIFNMGHPVRVGYHAHITSYWRDHCGK